MAEDQRIKSAIRAFMDCRPIDRVACQDFGMQQEDLLQQQLEAAVEAYLAGDVVVPREPTDAMLESAYSEPNSYWHHDTNEFKADWLDEMKSIYRAMIDAAPTPQRDRG